jgi:hypothetical protein
MSTSDAGGCRTRASRGLIPGHNSSINFSFGTPGSTLIKVVSRTGRGDDAKKTRVSRHPGIARARALLLCYCVRSCALLLCYCCAIVCARVSWSWTGRTVGAMVSTAGDDGDVWRCACRPWTRRRPREASASVGAWLGLGRPRVWGTCVALDVRRARARARSCERCEG